MVYCMLALLIRKRRWLHRHLPSSFKQPRIFKRIEADKCHAESMQERYDYLYQSPLHPREGEDIADWETGPVVWVENLGWCASSFARRVPTVCMTSTVSNTLTLSHKIIVLFAWFTFNPIPLQLVVPWENVTVGEWVTDNGAHLGQRSLYLEAAGGPNYVLPSIYVLWTSFLLPVSALTTWLQTNKHQ